VVVGQHSYRAVSVTKQIKPFGLVSEFAVGIIDGNGRRAKESITNHATTIATSAIARAADQIRCGPRNIHVDPCTQPLLYFSVDINPAAQPVVVATFDNPLLAEIISG